MDLKNYQVTVREILTNPAAKAVIRRELPEVMNSPLLSFAQSMTLRQVLVKLALFLEKHQQLRRMKWDLIWKMKMVRYTPYMYGLGR